MNERKTDITLIVVTACVFAAIAASTIYMVITAGVSGAVFAFIVLIVAISAWSKVIRERQETLQHSRLDDEIRELRRNLNEVTRKLDEIQKILEE